MKMVKSLLLGSAAGLVAVVGAQAADLPVKAKPVQYVKICTLYGDGFYYIPGSDTCIRFSGYIRVGYNWNGRAPHVQGAAGQQDRAAARFSAQGRANLGVDTRTQTAYGTLRTFANVNFENELGAFETVVTRAFIQWGGFTIGRTSSFVDHDGNLGDSGFRSLHTGLVDATTGANGINQLAYTWQLGNGITLNVGGDEARARSVWRDAAITNLSAEQTSSAHGASHFDPWASLRINQAWGRASAAFIAHKNAATFYGADTTTGYPQDKWGWAVVSGIEIRLDSLSPGSRIGGYVTYGVGASRITRNSQASPGLFGSGNQVGFGILTDAVFDNVLGASLQLTTTWAAGGGFEYFWTRNFSSTIYGGYTRTEYNAAATTLLCARITVAAGAACAGDAMNYGLWQIGVVNNWYPVAGLRFAVDVLYTGVETALEGRTLTLAAHGNRPAGGYLAKDLGILSVGARAQRSWGGGD